MFPHFVRSACEFATGKNDFNYSGLSEFRSAAALDFISSGSICVKLREPIATRDVFSLCEGIKASAAAVRVQCDGSFSPHLARSFFSFCAQTISILKHHKIYLKFYRKELVMF